MSTDAAAIAWYLHRVAPAATREAVAWPAPATTLHAPEYAQRLPTTQLAALFEQATLYGTRELACRAGLEAGAYPHTPLFLLMRASPRVRELTEHASEFWNAFSSSTRVESRVRGEAWEVTLVEGWRERTHALAVLTEFFVGAIVGVIATFARGRPKPDCVFLPEEDSAAQPTLESVLGTNVRLGADFTRIVYPRDVLEAWLATRDDLVARYLEASVRRSLHRLRRAISWQVDDLIRRQLPATVSMREAARELNLSERTLRRRLEREGTSFRERLDRVRRAQAIELLAHQDAAAVAEVLGFLDGRSFQRAFRRWTRMTPLEFQRRLRGASYDGSTA